MQGYSEEPLKDRLKADLQSAKRNPRPDSEIYKNLALWNKAFIERAKRADQAVKVSKDAIRLRKEAEKHIEYLLKELDQNERLRD